MTLIRIGYILYIGSENATRQRRGAMKKIYLLLLVVFVVLSIVALPVPAMSAGGGHGGGGHGGGGHGGWGHSGWGHGGWGHGGWGYGGWGWGWGLGLDPWWWGYPYYYYSYYDGYNPYYAAPPVGIQRQPQVYVQPAPQQEEQSYWYFCSNPQGYYPYVKKCPGGWMKVVPRSTPPDYRSNGEPVQAPPGQRR